jgi:uncharacterized protein (DUF2461 family)
LNSSTLQFLKDLKDNNDRLWFEKNRSRYEEAHADFMNLFEQLVNEVVKFDRGVAEDREGAKKVFRIYRDVRFSKDKSPYKKHLAGAIVPGGMKSGRAGYYVHIQPGGRSGAAGFDPADPAADYLKLKSFTVWKSFSDEEILSSSFVQKTASAFKALKMLNDFLNKAGANTF